MGKMLKSVLVAAALAAGSLHAQDTEKLALLVGNENYAAGYQLGNPCDDKEAVERELAYAGWRAADIFGGCDLSSAQIREEIDKFSKRYMDSDRPFGFIYIAGHGVQISENTYFFGTDADFDIKKAVERYERSHDARLFDGTLDIGRELLAVISDAMGGTLVIIIDACRNNPVEQDIKAAAYDARQRGETLDLKVESPSYRKSIPPFVKLVFSTARGLYASDGEPGKRSPFNQVFVAAMEKYASKSLAVVISEADYEIELRTAGLPIPQDIETFGELKLIPPPETCIVSCDGN